MKKSFFALIFMTAAILLASLFAEAKTATCAEQFEILKGKIEKRYSLPQRRQITLRVNRLMSVAQTTEILNLQEAFHDTDNIDTRIQLHLRAREIVRESTKQAGYRVRNNLPSPYDAVIDQKFSSDDGSLEYTVEVRNLLILQDSSPHVTLRMNRYDPKHNDLFIVSLGLMPNPNDDYVSWLPNLNANRVSGSFSQFIKSKLPAQCQ